MSLRTPLVITSLCLLLACAGQPATPPASIAATDESAAADESSMASGAPESSAPAPDSEPTATSVEPPPALPEKTLRRLPDDSVYPLLAAEFALRKRDYPTALALYSEQAEKLRDPAVSAHATHLAQYLKREDAAREAVTLWVELEPDNPEPHNTPPPLLVRSTLFPYTTLFRSDTAGARGSPAGCGTAPGCRGAG